MDEENSAQKRVVVLAMDGSTEAESALQWFSKNIYRKDDEVLVIHCLHHTANHAMGCTEHMTMGVLFSSFQSLNLQAIEKAFQKETNDAVKLCSQLEELLKKYEIEGKVIRVQGDPGHKIVTTAEECKASLIVLGSRGLGAVRRTILGSVSDYILHHATVPVLVYRG
ncbi:universal stress protein YxiE-like [Mytilus trossulus]|uniref:universal stress protein YxiE-like n=1 Tax=Mytilus trossulus TaxID=6551 RepID=UPI0030048333